MKWQEFIAEFTERKILSSLQFPLHNAVFFYKKNQEIQALRHFGNKTQRQRWEICFCEIHFCVYHINSPALATASKVQTTKISFILDSVSETKKLTPDQKVAYLSTVWCTLLRVQFDVALRAAGARLNKLTTPATNQHFVIWLNWPIKFR